MSAVVLVGATGCSDDAEDSTSVTTVAAVAHNDADIAFTQSMISHHQEAIDMSDAVIARGITPQVRSLAQRIKAAQDPEMRVMTAWLDDWGVPAAEPATSDGEHSMSGMMTTTQQDEFDAASGLTLDRLFLELMIAHHTGAVSMADEQIPAGLSSEAIALAKDIKAAQELESKEMQILLANLPAS